LIPTHVGTASMVLASCWWSARFLGDLKVGGWKTGGANIKVGL